MTAPKGYTLEYDLKGEPRKFCCGSKQQLDFRNSRRLAAVLQVKKRVRPKKIAETIRCCVKTVYEWVRKYSKGGSATLAEKSRRP